MKKLLLAVLIVAVTFSFVFAAARTDLLTEGFEGSFPPTGWHIKNMGDTLTGQTWMQSSSVPHSGTYKAFSQDGSSGYAMDEWLVTDAISVPADENLTLIFWHYLLWATWSDGPEYVLISTTDTAVASFTDTIFTLPGETPTSWDSVNLDLGMTYTGETIYIAFVHTSAAGYADAWCLDDIYMFSATFVVEPGDVILNELNIKTGSEWVELYNTTSVDIPLDSFHLMVASGPFDSILVGDTILANDYKVIYFPSNHLDNSGDSVGLYTINGTDTLLIDGVKYGNLGSAPVSPSMYYLARCGNTGNMGADWNMTAYSSEGAVNTVVGTDLGGGLIINEIDPYPSGAHDLVEIYNPTASAVNLLGYYLSDGDFFAPIVTNVTVDPGSWLTLEATVDWPAPMDFSSSDVAYLFRPDTTRIDQIGWYGEYNNFSFQRYTDGVGPNDGYDWISSGGGVTYFDALETWSAANWTRVQYNVSGIVGLDNNPPDSSGTIVNIVSTYGTYIDTTDASGAYALGVILDISNDTADFTVSHDNYDTLTVQNYIISDTTIDFTLNCIAPPPPAPTDLVAESGWDGMVPMHWAAAINGTLLSYVDGTPDSYFGYGAEGNGFAVKFTPASYPVTLNLARLLPLNGYTYDFYVFDDDGTAGAPSTVLYTKALSTVYPLEWNYVPLNITITDGSFYVGYLETSAGTNYFGRDTLNLDNTSWVFGSGVWESLETAFGGAYNCDFYFEAVVNDGTKDVKLTPTKPTINRGLKKEAIKNAKPYKPNFNYNTSNTKATFEYYRIYRDTVEITSVAGLTHLDTTSELAYTDMTVINDSTYHYVITGMYDTGESYPSNDASATPYQLVTSGDYMIIDMDGDIEYGGQGSEYYVEQSLVNLGYTGVTVAKDFLLANYTDLSGFNTVFALLGQNSGSTNMGVLGTDSPEESLLVNYLGAGGGLYIEGNDIGWTWDDGSGFGNIWSYFKTNYIDDGVNDAGTINGIAGSFAEGMTFSYVGPQDYIDHFTAGDAWALLENETPNYTCAIAAGDTTLRYNTVISAVAFGALTGTKTTPDVLMQAYYDFLISNSAYGIATMKKSTKLTYNLAQNRPNPAKGKTVVSYSIKSSGRVSVEVFNVLGQKVMTVIDRDQSAGVYKTTIDVSKLNAGIYFYKIKANDFSDTKKFMVVK